jgi:hypothetical protein
MIYLDQNSLPCEIARTLWREDEIEAWLASRPTENPTRKGIAKRNGGRS